MTPRVVLYGANGYSGRLLLPELRSLGLEPVVAGRGRAAITELGRELGLESRVFGLEDPGQVDAGLAGARVLLNAAGPFLQTARPLMDACLRQRVDYLDLTGEIHPLVYAAACDGIAKRLGVMLLPAVGFDVVPSDSLVMHLAGILPRAEKLTVSVSPSNLLSRGSAATAIAHAGGENQVRRDGRLETVRYRVQMRWTDFGSGMRPTVAASWGDLVTAFHVLGIPNIEVYFEATAFRFAAVAANELYSPSLHDGIVRPWLEAFARTLPRSGPSAAERKRERAVVVAELTRGRETVRGRIMTPEAYTFTAEAAPRIASAVLAGARRPGFQSPAGLLGADFVLGLRGVRRESSPAVTSA